jgi:HSP20 family protein
MTRRNAVIAHYRCNPTNTEEVMAEKTVPAPNAPQQRGDRELTRARERHVAPPVDIYEASDGLMLIADLPGVSKEGLEVRVDDGILTISGRPEHVAPPGDPVYREYELANFFRQFEIGDDIDRDRIGAELKHGVLTLKLPKAEKAKPKQIEVKVG